MPSFRLLEKQLMAHIPFFPLSSSLLTPLSTSPFQFTISSAWIPALTDRFTNALSSLLTPWVSASYFARPMPPLTVRLVRVLLGEEKGVVVSSGKETANRIMRVTSHDAVGAMPEAVRCLGLLTTCTGLADV